MTFLAIFDHLSSISRFWRILQGFLSETALFANFEPDSIATPRPDVSGTQRSTEGDNRNGFVCLIPTDARGTRIKGWHSVNSALISSACIFTRRRNGAFNAKALTPRPSPQIQPPK